MFLILLLSLGIAFVASVVVTLKKTERVQTVKKSSGFTQIVLWIDGSLASTTFAHNFVTALRENAFEKVQVCHYDADSVNTNFCRCISVFLVSDVDIPFSGVAFTHNPAGFILISLSDVPDNPIVEKWKSTLTKSMQELLPPISTSHISNPRVFKYLCQRILRLIHTGDGSVINPDEIYQ